MGQFAVMLIVLFSAMIGSAQPPPSTAGEGDHSLQRDTAVESRPQSLQKENVTPSLPSYPNTPDGLEKMMGDMISLQRNGKTSELLPYLRSLTFPEPDVWFNKRFGTVHCDDEKVGANDCLGPRIAFTYATIAQVLQSSFELTLKDLIHEGLTNFEAIDYAQPCAGPYRIVASRQLVGELTTTKIIGTLSRLHESVYVLWIYNKGKETTLPFFVYSQGAFRYIGMPHESSVEDYQKKMKGGVFATESESAARYLTEDQLEMKEVMIDPAIAERTAVVHVSIGSDGKVKDAAYVRGPASYRDAALQKVRKQHFDKPGFGPRGIHPNFFCVNVTVPR